MRKWSAAAACHKRPRENTVRPLALSSKAFPTKTASRSPLYCSIKRFSYQHMNTPVLYTHMQIRHKAYGGRQHSVYPGPTFRLKSGTTRWKKSGATRLEDRHRSMVPHHPRVSTCGKALPLKCVCECITTSSKHQTPPFVRIFSTSVTLPR
jgi:hypothetical protein